MAISADDINANLGRIEQDAIRDQIKRAKRDGRALGPDMFAPDHSTYKPVEGLGGAGRLFIREDKHEGLSNKSIAVVPDGEYGS